MPRNPPYRLNVVGDFYVEAGCCTLCGVPEVEAPDLFQTSVDAEQCYVKRQPTNEGELQRMLSAMACQDIDCIRYAGRDGKIVKQLVKLNAGATCDALDSPWGRVKAWLLRLF